ncbi:hypothetical protein AAD018_009780 [Aestuariibius insulae]|uniref:hypothetical protein n=1 Tax=Aestuariibius insulae TaxID=2058287 RepID=UPI0034886650
MSTVFFDFNFEHFFTAPLWLPSAFAIPMPERALRSFSKHRTVSRLVQCEAPAMNGFVVVHLIPPIR